MIRRGIRTNPTAVARALALYTADLEDARDRAKRFAPAMPVRLTSKTRVPTKTQPTFNIGSGPQVIRYCLDRGYEVPRDKKTKKYTVDDGALTWLLERHPDDPILLARQDFMGARQILSHYIDEFYEWEMRTHSKMGKKLKEPKRVRRLGVRPHIFPEILIHTQKNGRWSIINPPLQQPPHDLYDRMGCKDPWAGLIIPEEGEAWLVYDRSQVEPRLLAVLAQDEVALSIFREGRDFHSENTQLIFNEVTPTKRNFGKRFILRLHYRGDARTSGDIPGARALGLTGDKLVPLAQRYLRARPAIPRYWSKQDDEVRSRREQRTFCGRRRRTTSPEITPTVLRELGNHPMSGGVSDIMNLTEIEIDAACPWTRLVFTVHDQTIRACRVPDLARTVPLVHEIVHREWDVEGHKTVFPAEIKVVYPPKKEASCEPS